MWGLAWGMRAWGDRDDEARQRHRGRKLLGVYGKLHKVPSLCKLRLEVGERERRLDSEAGVGRGQACMPGLGAAEGFGAPWPDVWSPSWR